MQYDELQNAEDLKQRIDRILIGLTRYFGRTEADISHLLYHRDSRVAIKWTHSSKGPERTTLYAEVDFSDNSVTLTRDRDMIGR